MDAIQEDAPLTVDTAAERILNMDAPPEPSDSDSPEVEAVEEVVTEEVIEVAAEDIVETEETGETEDDDIVSYRADLMEHLSDKDQYDHLSIPTNVNGVEGKATITELLRDYQLNGNLDQKTESLVNDRKALDAENAKAREAYTSQLNQAAELVTQLEQRLVSDGESVNWQELRESDPAEFSAKRQELQERQQQLLNARTSIQQETQTKQTENYQNLVQRESAALLNRFPAWADDTVAKLEKGHIRDYLIESGFSTQEVDGATDAQGNIVSMGVIDHRAITLAQKAMLYDKGTKKVDVIKKKVKKLPKVAKPGSPKGVNEENAELKAKRMSRFKKRGGKVDDAAAILEKMFGG